MLYQNLKLLSLYPPLTAAVPRIAEKILIFVNTEPHNSYCKLIRVLFYDDDIVCLSSSAIPSCTKYMTILFAALLWRLITIIEAI
jgi:hypothetical protein